ncbi:TRAP transporter small permease [Corynebacterium ulceribovis]|uniref:TRAP transporter small permease n=1 Tax=Corynebacterium ulceribovis TaxID=487732 RepID=UPI00037D5B40|nr:TRAP transporter small permease [Corynebacterium ulceribovis]
MGSIIVHPGRHGTGERTTFGFITDDYPLLHKLQNGISGVCAVIAAVAVALSGILTLIEVVMRSFFKSPLGWNIGFAERYLMIAIAFFGVVTAYRTGAHIAVATLFGKFPPVAQKLLILMAEAICAVTFALLMWAGIQSTSFSISINEQIPPGMAELAWPSWTWRVMVPIASGLGLIVVLIDLFRELTTSWTAAHTDYEPGEES